MDKVILVVEDEKVLANAVNQELKQAGFNTQVVYTGAEALEAIEANQYALVLLDILMPNVNGWQVLEKLKEKNIKTIVMSNLSHHEDIERAKKMGADDYIVKTDISLSELMEKVKSLVKAKLDEPAQQAA